MDTITHTVLGACIGEAIAGKKLGKQAMLWGALANNIPDIDVFSSMWLSQVDSLLAHRGFTHSILFAVLFSTFLAYIFSRWHRNKKMFFKDWLFIFSSGMFIHIFIDALTCYGTGWYEPFSHERVSMNVLFVADPLYTISLLVSFIALLILNSKNKSRKKWTRAGLFISTFYIVLAFINKWYVDSLMRHELIRQNINYSDYITTPAPLNNFLWYVVAKNDSGYNMGYYSFFDSRKQIGFNFRKQNENYLSALPQDKDLITLKRFAQNYYTADKSGDTLYFSDVRFGTVGGWNDTKADFVFRYCLDKNANNDLVIQRGRMKAINGSAFESLWKRIKGN